MGNKICWARRRGRARRGVRTAFQQASESRGEVARSETVEVDGCGGGARKRPEVDGSAAEVLEGGDSSEGKEAESHKVGYNGP